MRFHYLDPGLRDDLGHHANVCRLICGEFRRRGIETSIHTHAELRPQLAAELGARGHFRYYSYFHFSSDPVCGWLIAFHDGVTATRQDLAKLTVGKDDIVYLNTAQPVQLMSLIQWLTHLGPDRRPTTIVEFSTDSGLDVTAAKGEFRVD